MSVGVRETVWIVGSYVLIEDVIISEASESHEAISIISFRTRHVLMLICSALCQFRIHTVPVLSPVISMSVNGSRSFDPMRGICTVTTSHRRSRMTSRKIVVLYKSWSSAILEILCTRPEYVVSHIPAPAVTETVDHTLTLSFSAELR